MRKVGVGTERPPHAQNQIFKTVNKTETLSK